MLALQQRAQAAEDKAAALQAQLQDCDARIHLLQAEAIERSTTSADASAARSSAEADGLIQQLRNEANLLRSCTQDLEGQLASAVQQAEVAQSLRMSEAQADRERMASMLRQLEAASQRAEAAEAAAPQAAEASAAHAEQLLAVQATHKQREQELAAQIVQLQQQLSHAEQRAAATQEMLAEAETQAARVAPLEARLAAANSDLAAARSAAAQPVPPNDAAQAAELAAQLQEQILKVKTMEADAALATQLHKKDVLNLNNRILDVQVCAGQCVTHAAYLKSLMQCAW
jgi:chromosome segregation ATPase